MRKSNFLNYINKVFSSINKIRYNLIDDRVGEIQIINSEKRNSLSLSIIDELKNKIHELENSQNFPKAVILCNEGKVFSSGHDLAEMLYTNDREKIIRECSDLMMKMRNSKILYVAEVQGLATAAGFQLAESCDLIIASSKASFSIPGLKIGLYASTPAVPLIENIPKKLAFDILLNGTVFSANEAYKHNFINYVIEQEDFDDIKIEKDDLRNKTMGILQGFRFDNIKEIKEALYNHNL